MRALNYSLLISFFFLFFLQLSVKSVAQVKDTIHTDTFRVAAEDRPKHSPTKASLFSTFVPGLGQAYNKKYWKIPIIYVGMGIPIFYGLEQNDLFVEKKTAYTNRLSGDSTDKYLETGNFFSNDALLESMDINKRNRDLMIIIAGVIYVLQIVDASVDAHLFYFNVSDDLSIHYSPILYYSRKERDAVKGLSLSLYF